MAKNIATSIEPNTTTATQINLDTWQSTTLTGVTGINTTTKQKEVKS